MQTYLKNKPGAVQFFMFLAIAAASFLILGTIGTLIVSGITGTSITDIEQATNFNKNPNALAFSRGLQLVQFISLFLIPSFLFAFLSHPRPALWLGLKPPTKNMYWILGIGIMLVSIPLVEYTGLLNRDISLGQAIDTWVRTKEAEATKMLQFMLGHQTVEELILNIIFIALLAGVGEELLFRGVLQRIFITWFKSPWLGIILAAFLFSALHVQFLGFFPRFILGILLGAICWYSGSLWPSIIAHFFYDAFFITLSYFYPQFVDNPDTTIVNPSSVFLMALVSLGLVLLIIWVMKKNSEKILPENFSMESAPGEETRF